MDDIFADKQLMTRRTFVIGLGKIGLLFLLAGRMFYMQFIKKDEYKTLSDKNRIKMILISPDRGRIIDIRGNVIAQNNTCFNLLLDKNISSKFLDEVEFIINLLELDRDQANEVIKRVKKGGRRVSTILIDCLKWNQVAIIEERKPELKSLFIETGFERNYNYGAATAHLIGYLGRPESSQMQDIKLADESFKIGKNGIEKFYEKTLRGEFGLKRIEVNALGKYVRELSYVPSKIGKNIYLNIDAELQKHIYEYLSPQGCSAIVTDCTTGGISACVSSPSFDPNQFNRLSNHYWQSLTSNEFNPLIDKTIKSLYPPGSVFKIITALAALEYGISHEHIFTCTGRPELGGNSFRCASSRGHGSLNMTDALKYSCNIYFYNIARIIGAKKILDIARKFGFGQATGVDLPGELTGFLPSEEWKKQKFGTKWTLGDSFNLAIGQGFLLVTPMQLARFITAVASGGKLFTPRIANRDPHYTLINVKQENLNIIKLALYNTINTRGGTGYYSRINYNSMEMAGKTGTAQVQAKKSASDDLNSDHIAWKSRNHAIFCGYAPFENPKYTVSVYFDHGGGGGKAAAPIAKKIMTEVLSNYYI